MNSDFKVQEDLLSLEPMHETRRGENLFEKLLLAMRKLIFRLKNQVNLLQMVLQQWLIHKRDQQHLLKNK